MRPDLESLIVSESEVEAIAGVDVNDVLLGLAYRPALLQDFKKLLSFAIAQLFMFGVICIFLTPIGISIVRNSGFSGEDAIGTVYFLGITLALASIVMLLLNFYLWKRGKKFETFSNFLEEITKYNEVVRSLDILDKIEAAGGGVQVSDREETVEALRVTRDSLLGSLRTERILREHKGFFERRYELFAKIENDLATLRGLEISDEASEYGRLLNQALKIGVSVDREVRRLQNRQ